MTKQIHYSNEPLGEIRRVADFLPSPEELILKSEQTKVTISLSSESVAFFKQAAKKHHTQYQKMIRLLLDEYVAQQKRIRLDTGCAPRQLPEQILLRLPIAQILNRP